MLRQPVDAPVPPPCGAGTRMAEFGPDKHHVFHEVALPIYLTFNN
jgi:hypothetical protein